MNEKDEFYEFYELLTKYKKINDDESRIFFNHLKKNICNPKLLSVYLKKREGILSNKENIFFVLDVIQKNIGKDEGVHDLFMEKSKHMIDFAVSKATCNFSIIDKNKIDDFKSLGFSEFWKSIKKYNPSYKCKFSSFAIESVKNACMMFLWNDCGPIKIPQNLYKLNVKINQFEEEYFKTHGRVPTLLETSSHFGCKENKIVEAKDSFLKNNISFINDDNQINFFNLGEYYSSKCIFKQIEEYDNWAETLDKIRLVLTEDMYFVINSLYDLENEGYYYSNKDIAKIMNKSVANVSMLKKRAFDILRKSDFEFLRKYKACK